MYKFLIAFSAVFLLATSNEAEAVRAQSLGGSNYAWYAVGPLTPGQNCREAYGIISNYHLAHVRNTVRGQLASMYANGQRRLRIPLFHGHGLATGTVIDSTGGNLSANHRLNLRNFLADIRTAGFVEIVFGFFPVGAYNDPTQWGAWNEAAFQENWNLIVNLRPILTSAGLQYRIDLMNEGAPTSGQTQLKEYVRKLWINYNIVFGKSDTLGFSIIGDNVDRYRTMRSIMVASGYGTPYLYSVHFYESSIDSNAILSLHNAMLANSDSQGWIIGEALYEDQGTFNKLVSTSLGSRQLYFLLQWPVTRARRCDGHVDIAPPTAFSLYRQL